MEKPRSMDLICNEHRFVQIIAQGYLGIQEIIEEHKRTHEGCTGFFLMPTDWKVKDNTIYKFSNKK